MVIKPRQQNPQAAAVSEDFVSGWDCETRTKLHMYLHGDNVDNSAVRKFARPGSVTQLTVIAGSRCETVVYL